MSLLRLGVGASSGGEALPVAGVFAWYTAKSWTGTQWNDLSGNGHHATSITGTITRSTVTGNGATSTFDALSGSTTAGIIFPSAVLPSTYTLCHVARYNGTESRIFDGSNPVNFLSGFWGGNAGVAYHSGWITPQTDYHGTNWVISTDQNSLYRSKSKAYNGGAYNQHTGGGSSSANLTINRGNYSGGPSAVSSSEQSDWMVAEVIVYNSTLSSGDYNLLETYLETKYGI